MTDNQFIQHKIQMKDGDIEFEVFAMNDYILPPFSTAYMEGYPKRMRDILNLNTRPDDVLLLTYPKCGTHWSYEIINMLLQGSAKYMKEKKAAAMMEALPDLALLERLPTPRVINTHVFYKWIPRKHIETGGKIIHVTRNPKDAYTSSFYHTKESQELGPKTNVMTWAHFFDNCVSENGKLKLYGSWFEYEREISTAKKTNKQILTVHYEKLKREPLKEVRRIGQFLGVHVTDQLIKDIIEKCEFENLKNASEKYKEMPFELIEYCKETEDKLEYKAPVIYRKGEVGNWKTHFTVAQNEMFDRMFEKEMQDIDLEVIY